MTSYLMVLAAVVLLSLDFAVTKFYQKREGAAVTAGLYYNAAIGLFSGFLFWGLSGFRFSLTPFSTVMAAAMALCTVVYTLIGFRIMKKGNMAVYTLFLMSGGMLLPYIYGLIFLEETFSMLRLVGLCAILVAVVLSNGERGKADKELLLLCIAVFILNGLVSIVSKCHQIEAEYKVVGSAQFVMLTGFAKFMMSVAALLVVRRREKEKLPKVTGVLPLVVGSAALSGVSYLLQLVGAKELPATVLYPMVTGGSVLFTAFAAKLFFREKITARQWISIGLCILGTLLFL